MELRANERRIDTSAKCDAVFTSYQISCKYKLSSGRNHSRHSARGNYQQDMSFFFNRAQCLELEIMNEYATHAADMDNNDNDH